MWSDNESDVDLLRYRYLASTIVRLTQMRHLLPTTIGVFSDWGGGKSTLLKMAQAELDNFPNTLCLSFNGWLFAGYEDAKSALLGTILDAIADRTASSQSLTDKGQALLGKLIDRVNWMRVASLAGRYVLPTMIGLPHLTLANAAVDAVKAGKDAVDSVRETGVDPAEAEQLFRDTPGASQDARRNIRDFRRDFADLLHEAKITSLVVFIDDLDRCLPDTIIETLEAIKLFLYVPGTAFVLAADERIVKYAVRQRFPELPGDQAEVVGRDYLEKLVQIPIRVPPLSGADVSSYMNLLFAQLHLKEESLGRVCDHVAAFRPSGVSEVSFDLATARTILNDEEISPELQRDLDLATQIAPVLIPGLAGNPRRTKRFLNSFILRLELGHERGLDLQRRVLAKLMLLEYLKPEFFLQIARMQATQDGKPSELTVAEDYLSQVEVSITADASEEHRDSREPTDTDKPSSIPESDGIERSNTSTTPSTERDLPVTVQNWFADTWMKTWMASDPPLGDIDLRAYFYIAHDLVGSLDASPLRLSPVAEFILQQLLSPGAITQERGLNSAANLSMPDVTAIFENLAVRIRQAEELDARSPRSVLFKLVQKRPELAPQLVALYDALPETKLPVSTPPLLWETIKGTQAEAAGRNTLQRWTQSSNTTLALATQVIRNHFEH